MDQFDRTNEQEGLENQNTERPKEMNSNEQEISDFVGPTFGRQSPEILKFKELC